ncbi:MAG TPA: hemerythrin domain-containing protein [Bacteroidota bacterium]
MSGVQQSSVSRRLFLAQGAGAVSGGVLLGAFPALAQESSESEVSPAEDLMREHGVLKRTLLVYAEISSRLRAGKEFPVKTLTDGAGIIRQFIEEYHEKLEEDHLFPRFKKAGKLTDLVDVLLLQHQRGRVLTDRISQLAGDALLKNKEDQRKMAGYLDAFTRMYNPHEAREDTVLFPALHTIMKPAEYDAMGDEFEKKEHQLFGEEGFEKFVEKVADLERSLGIYDLSKFTPSV